MYKESLLLPIFCCTVLLSWSMKKLNLEALSLLKCVFHNTKNLHVFWNKFYQGLFRRIPDLKIRFRNKSF